MAYHKAQALKRTVDVGWMARSVCGGQDLELFFGPDGERQVDREVREVYATQVCFGCPVIKDCFEYAMERKESGVWGGSTDDERKSVRRRRMRQANAA
jgi:WhiB family redox-sensing transcriptional regulator